MNRRVRLGACAAAAAAWIVNIIMCTLWHRDTDTNPAAGILTASAAVSLTILAVAAWYHGKKRPAWMTAGDDEALSRAALLRHVDPVAADVENLKAGHARLERETAENRHRISALLDTMARACDAAVSAAC